MIKPFDIRDTALHFVRWRRRRSAMRCFAEQTYEEWSEFETQPPDFLYSDEPDILVRFRKNEYPLNDERDGTLIPPTRRLPFHREG